MIPELENREQPVSNNNLRIVFCVECGEIYRCGSLSVLRTEQLKHEKETGHKTKIYIAPPFPISE